MKKHLNAKNFIIVILIILLFLAFFNPGGHLPNRTVLKVDSIPYVVFDTVTVDSLVEVEVEIEVPVEIEVEKRIEVPVLTPVDTNEILKIYFAKIQHKEVLTLPNNVGTVTITDTISKNSIVNRKFISDIKQMIVKDTIYTKEPKKGQMFFGFNGGFNKSNVVSHIGTGLMYKTKEDKIFHVGLGVANRLLDGTNGQFTPFVDGGVYWKIKLKK
jgi:hypothetical protein